MRDLFRPWQRKIGCGLLVLACAVLVLGMRSRIYGDFITLDREGGRREFVASFQGSLKWIAVRDEVKPVQDSDLGADCDRGESAESCVVTSGFVDPNKILPPWYGFSLPTRYETDETLMPIFGGTEYNWVWKRRVLGCLAAEADFGETRVAIWMIPHWALMVVLILMSALFLFWPRRRRPTDPVVQKHGTEPG